MVQNYTKIDHLIKKHNAKTTSFHKESEPMLKSSEKYEIKESLEHLPEEEVRPFVSPRSETIELPPDLKKLGVHSAAVSKFPTYQNVTLPISDDKIISGLQQPPTSSIRWLATFALYILRQAHLTLRVVKGKIIRVVKS